MSAPSEHKPRPLLPNTYTPVKYTLTFHPRFTDWTFSGEELIFFKVHKPNVKEIVLHSSDLEVSNAFWISSAGMWVKSSSNKPISFDTEAQTVTIPFDQALPEGEGRLKLEFKGKLLDNLKGFYKSVSSNPTTNMATTQFEPTDARRAFPCVDEPAAKATFVVTIIHPSTHTALSNMPGVTTSSTAFPSELQTVFEESPIMSTYLLALIVGEFEYIEDTTSSGVKVRVYAVRGKQEQGRFALQVAVKTLPYYNEWFGVDYPLPKCDLIAIPDFAAGAMENWGCITYRETALLVDEKNSSEATKQWVALVVGHELAHMWFGNLVTMDWWTYLWLNEGFASWIEYLAVDHCFPEWDIWTSFIFSDLNRALKLDSLKSSHPVEVEVGHPSEVEEIFDIISYSKGCSIIRMLYNYLGEKQMKQGLKIYLNKFKYRNAETDDLWAALDQAAENPGKDYVKVKHLMDGWIKQEGYPVIKVEEVGPGKFSFTQNRFLSQGEGQNPENQKKWNVPLTIQTPNSKNIHREVLSAENAVIDLGEKSAWIKVNPEQTGFYIVNYSEDLLNRLKEPLSTLTASDRIGLVGDQFTLARAGLVKVSRVLDLLNTSYRTETNLNVWKDITANLGDFENAVLSEAAVPVRQKWFKFINELYGEIGRQVGWDSKTGESGTTGMLRALVLAKLGAAAHEGTISEARNRFKNLTGINADLKAVIYRLLVATEKEGATGDDDYYEQILALYRDASASQEEKDRLSRALGHTKSKEKITRTLEWAMNSGEVRHQDIVFVVGVLSSCGGTGREIVWDYIKKNWDTVHDKFKGQFLLSRLVGTALGGYSTEEKAKEAEQWFNGKKVESAERAVKQAIEGIRSNAEWRKRSEADVVAWLNSNF